MIQSAHANSSFGLDDYDMPSAGLQKKPVQPTINKSKAPGPIEAEANYRKNFPGAGSYTIPEAKTWEV